MTLQLYVWGPAFGLPSIDAECIAAIAYLAQTTSKADYQLIQSSPSAVPTHHLPALHDPSTRTWISGYTSIVRHLQSHPPPSFHDATFPPPTPTIQADSKAYITFLSTNATPLIALYLYVSSANWAASTRPAYSKILPIPLPWIEPAQLRQTMSARAEHLGMSSLDTDVETEKEEQEAAAARRAGWISIPASLTTGPKNVGEVMAPEEKRRIRLDSLASEVLDVIGEVEWATLTLGARCAVLGWVSLMVVDEGVPKRWLAEVTRQRYSSLVEFVQDFSSDAFGPSPSGWESLPWVKDEPNTHGFGLGLQQRLAHGVMYEIPWVGEAWRRWWAGRRRREVLEYKGIKQAPSWDGVIFTGLGITALTIGAAIWYWRTLPRFGAPVQRWENPVFALGGLGAVGAFLSSNVFDEL
ncbi:outer mitochondrial membrane transport complex protein-domain-containing protein [Triangularia verruculosa]|uniref:Outer mitochondrial membrane transport complex protein-domain-containing protein n=1 Tax=Triangularia verruculosa TaxID=2587418 RepID=A0AAN6XUL7_9PEZI|nr:outer mitochondrial membrane transport complex protein-domain-containing protein [Triangularia verruculosa]